MMNPSQELAFNFSADHLDIINKDADIVGQMCCLREAHNINLGITQISFSNHIFSIISFFAKVKIIIILPSVVLLPTNLTILLLKCQTITIHSSKGGCTAHNNLEHMITITCLDGKDGNAIIPNNCNRKGDYSK